jgi:hypothetical protein
MDDEAMEEMTMPRPQPPQMRHPMPPPAAPRKMHNGTNGMPQARPTQFNFPQQPVAVQPQMQNMQPQPIQEIRQPQPPRQMPQAPLEETMKPIDDIETTGAGTPEAPQQTPQDWLKPKIFKGGGLV